MPSEKKNQFINLAKGQGTMQDPKKLREMAAWYRRFAERAGNPMIWECRLRTAEDLEAEAQRIEKDEVGADGSDRTPRRAPLHVGT